MKQLDLCDKQVHAGVAQFMQMRMQALGWDAEQLWAHLDARDRSAREVLRRHLQFDGERSLPLLWPDGLLDLLRAVGADYEALADYLQAGMRRPQ